MSMSHHRLSAAFVGALLMAGTVAHAQTAGTTVVSAGWFRVMPQSDSVPLRTTNIGGAPVNIVSTGTGAKVEDADTLGLAVSYFFTDNISGELVAGVPPRHKVSGEGKLAPFGVIGSVRQWSPAILAKYHFGTAQQRFRPYVGLGINYTWFTDGKITSTPFSNATFGPGATTTVKADSSWNPVFNIGATYAMTDRWILGLSVSYLPLKTKATLNTRTATGVPVTSETSIKIRPVVTFLTVGYAF
jgi:outer membrane protein